MNVGEREEYSRKSFEERQPYARAWLNACRMGRLHGQRGEPTERAHIATVETKN